jgi:hypothetical protein
LKGTRPMTDSLPPLIEPNGRFSHIRLSEFGRVCALPRAPSIRVDEDGPRGGVSPRGAIGHRSLLTSEQVSHLRSTPVTGASSLLRRTPTSPATPPASLVLPACTDGWVLHPPPEFSQLSLAELTDVLPTLTPPERWEGSDCCPASPLRPSPIKERLGLSPVLRFSRLIRCGSFSLRPVCSSSSASNPASRRRC